MATCKILMQDLNTTDQPVAIVDGDFLNFSKNHLITGINIVEDLLFWTDNFNQPRRINVEKAINDPSYYDNEDKVSVAKFAPYLAPFVIEHKNLSVVSNENTQKTVVDIKSDYLKDKFVRFSYRYQFNEDEYSIYAPFTQIVFQPLNNGVLYQDPNVTYSSSNDYDTNVTTYGDPLYGTTKIIDTTEVEAMQNALNFVQLRIPIPSQDDYMSSPLDGVFQVTTVGSNTLNNATFSGSISPGTYIVKGVDSTSLTNGVTQVTFSSTITTNLGAVTLDSGGVENSAGDKFVLVKMWENTSDIKKIDVLLKESHQTAVRKVGEIKVDTTKEFTATVDVYPVKPISAVNAYWRYCVTYNYRSERPIKVLPENQLVRATDIIPRLAKAQEVVSNRIVYGNIVQNYDLPKDSAGITGINFFVESTIKGTEEYNSGALTYGPLQHNEIAYPYLSLKQRRTYKVGIVLSDRYGRKSPVITSTTGNRLSSAASLGNTYSLGDTFTVNNDSTAYDDSYGPSRYSWSGDEDDIRGLDLIVTFDDERLVDVRDVYDPETNKTGWYSYSIVVQQLEQDFYNVYVPHPMTYESSFDTPSYISLFGGNINKIPRSTADNDINRDGIAGSEVFLFPKVIQNGGGVRNRSAKMNSKNTLIDVLNIGSRDEQGLEVPSNNSQNPDKNAIHPDQYDDYTASPPTIDNFTGLVYKNEKTPLIADIANMDAFFDTDVVSTASSPIKNPLNGVTVFETQPTESAIDIYYETSTSGLVKDLNLSLLANKPSYPTNIDFNNTGDTLKTLSEATTGTLGAAYTITADKGTGANTLKYYILEVRDYKNNITTDVSSKLSVNQSSGVLTVDSNGFAFRNKDGWDTYDIVVKVEEYNTSGTYVGAAFGILQLEITNAAPSITSIPSVYLLLDEKQDVRLVDENKASDYAGIFENGGTDYTGRFEGCTINLTFPNMSLDSDAEEFEKCFKIETNVPNKGTYSIVTTKDWENKSEQRRLYFFDELSDSERQATLTITDVDGTSTATTTVYIKERESEVKVNYKLYPYYATSFTANPPGVYNGFTIVYPSIEPTRTEFVLKQGANPSRVNKDGRPATNNVLYQSDGETLAIYQNGVENFILSVGKVVKDIPMIWLYQPNVDVGNGDKEYVVYGYCIVDKLTSIIKKVVVLPPEKSNKAAEKLMKQIRDIEGLLDSDFT
jgi:hypothetical protein